MKTRSPAADEGKTNERPMALFLESFPARARDSTLAKITQVLNPPTRYSIHLPFHHMTSVMDCRYIRDFSLSSRPTR